uniref:WAP domain-containing protein n=1 Tax=Panagrellus redivivus TaxID=6233 RepID=A0A7E4UMY8_PANRE
MATFLIGFLSVFASVNGITFHRWGGNGNWYPQPHGPPANQGGTNNYVPYTPNNNVAVGYPTAYSLGAFVRPGGNGGGGYEQQGSGNQSNRQLVRCMNGGAHIGHCRLDDDSICIALGGTCVNSVCCTTPFMSLSTTPASTKAPHVIDGDAYQPKVRSSSEEADVDGIDNTSKSRKHGRSGSNEDPEVDPTDVSPESRETTTFRPKPRSRKPTTTTMRPMESGSAESYEFPRPTAPPVDGSVEKLSTIDEERLTEIDELSRLLELGRKSGLTTDSPIFSVFAGLFERKTKTTTPMPPMPMWPGGQMPMFPVFPEWFNRFTLPPPMPIATLVPVPIPTTTEITTTEMTTKLTTKRRPTTTKAPTTRKSVPKIVQIFPVTTTTTTTTTTVRPTTAKTTTTTTTPVNSVETSDSNESAIGLSSEDPEFDNYHRKTCDSGTRPIGPCTKDLSCPVDHSCEDGGICCYDYTMVLKRMRLAPENPNIYDFSQFPAMPMFSHV